MKHSLIGRYIYGPIPLYTGPVHFQPEDFNCKLVFFGLFRFRSDILGNSQVFFCLLSTSHTHMQTLAIYSHVATRMWHTFHTTLQKASTTASNIIAIKMAATKIKTTCAHALVRRDMRRVCYRVVRWNSASRSGVHTQLHAHTLWHGILDVSF